MLVGGIWPRVCEGDDLLVGLTTIPLVHTCRVPWPIDIYERPYPPIHPTRVSWTDWHLHINYDYPYLYPFTRTHALTRQVEALNEDMLGRVLSVMEESEAHGWEFVTARKGTTVHRKFMVRVPP